MTHPSCSSVIRLAFLASLCLGLVHAQCPVTGAYATGDGSDGNQASPLGTTPPYHLTATNSTFSYVVFYPGQSFTFAQLASFSATFTSNAGGAGGGAPRLRILLDADSDNDPIGDGDANDASISVYLGPSPSFVSNDAVLNTYSNFNVIGNNDAGRYDTSGMPTGGSPFTTYADALAKYGSLRVLRLGFVIDTFSAFPSRDETLVSINGSFTGPACVTVPTDAYQVVDPANLLIGDSVVNITNAGTRNGFDPAGGICANVYVFDPSEELIACCSCYVSPDGLRSLSAKQDLVSNTLTPGVPGSIVIKMLASTPPGGPTSCDASSPTIATLEPGLRAWSTDLHQNTAAGNYQVTENAFQNAVLSASELAKLTTFCGFIQANGSTFGVCRSCRFGGLGGSQQ